MLILRSLPPSPFGRKIRLAAAILSLSDRVTVQSADTNDASDSLRKQNPLGKIPTLILEDGSTLFDSRVISEYLDMIAGGGRIIPQNPADRFAALRLQAIGDGMMDASILQVYEGRWRPAERHEPKWVAYQSEKVTRALAALEAEPPGLGRVLHVGHIALACALGYLDLRFGGRWRAGHPRLVSWLDDFATRVPEFEATRVAA